MFNSKKHRRSQARRNAIYIFHTFLYSIFQNNISQLQLFIQFQRNFMPTENGARTDKKKKKRKMWQDTTVACYYYYEPFALR